MHKILISVFDTETAAFKGVTALKELHRDGDITLYASTVIAKDASGWQSVKQADDSGPAGTLVGLVTGSLIGLLGGPVGVAVGAYAGTMGGIFYDLFHAGVSMDFVNEVAADLTPGKVALVADIDEEWVTPVETRFGALGATTYRRLPDEVIDDALVREAEAAKAELEALDAELRASAGEARTSVEAAIATQREKAHALAARIDAELSNQRAELDARVATLHAQRDETRDRERARIDTRIAELNASFASRRAKLERARTLARESAALTREAVLA